MLLEPSTPRLPNLVCGLRLHPARVNLESAFLRQDPLPNM
jgi:hypothetical protein